MRKIILMASVFILAIAACTVDKVPTSYSICNDTDVTNNDCPDVTSNIVIEDDINGMNK